MSTWRIKEITSWFYVRSFVFQIEVVQQMHEECDWNLICILIFFNPKIPLKYFVHSLKTWLDSCWVCVMRYLNSLPDLTSWASFKLPLNLPRLKNAIAPCWRHIYNTEFLSHVVPHPRNREFMLIFFRRVIYFSPCRVVRLVSRAYLTLLLLSSLQYVFTPTTSFHFNDMTCESEYEARTRARNIKQSIKRIARLV